MTTKIIHVNKNVIASDAKHSTSSPACRVEIGNVVKYGREVIINGPSRMVYRPESPRDCGARLWIETESDIEIIGETTYREIPKHRKAV